MSNYNDSMVNLLAKSRKGLEHISPNYKDLDKKQLGQDKSDNFERVKLEKTKVAVYY